MEHKKHVCDNKMNHCSICEKMDAARYRWLSEAAPGFGLSIEKMNETVDKYIREQIPAEGLLKSALISVGIEKCHIPPTLRREPVAFYRMFRKR